MAEERSADANERRKERYRDIFNGVFGLVLALATTGLARRVLTYLLAPFEPDGESQRTVIWFAVLVTPDAMLWLLRRIRAS